MQDDDAIVEDLSDVEVDLGFIENPGEGIWYETLDPVSTTCVCHKQELTSAVEEVMPQNWVPIWTGDEEYEKFEVHGRPTNMVVDLSKRLCTCQFWMLTGISCVHACAALARVNKRPEDFCHPLKTYEHHINFLSGQFLWEKLVYNQPQAPNIKRKPEKLTTKRRKDADEGTSENKKPKGTVTLKRQLKPFTCTYCGIKGHTKRGCKKKRADELAAAVTKSKIVPNESTPASEAMNTTNVTPQVDEAPPGVVVQNHAQVEVTDNLPPPPVATEIDLSQPNYGVTQDKAPPLPPTTRPDKLLTKRRNSPSPVTASVDPMQGASAATSFRLANFLKFIPTPGFKPPRKKTTNLQIANPQSKTHAHFFILLQNCHYHLLQRLPIGKIHTTVFYYTVSNHRSTGRFPHPQCFGTREALLRLGVLVVDRIEPPSTSFARPTMVKPSTMKQTGKKKKKKKSYAPL
ncbi:hypothetical protein Ahy_A10g047403 [Arachis hypogaea]|uniref:SWIM-type domain-containing protein n=1 Tax=Arachis hypogaea TaxID=3818 RepID=A0A445B2I8_ARAHY|nr:hypothetical protein Ahy_A10g047403 [Arachis hypogaea]